MIKEIDYFFNW